MLLVEKIIRTGAYIRKVYEEIPETLNLFKGERDVNVSKIVVTVNIDGVDIEFDGDERSQNRLNRAYTVAKNKNKNVFWKTYNNDLVELNADQILDILDAAGTKQTELWI